MARAGAAGFFGVFQLARHRNGSAGEFQAAKYWSLVACGVSILMLFGGCARGLWFRSFTRF
jgi:hypothetical protein